MNKITTRSARARLRHGFTLVELVIVIAVIAVLAAVLVPTFISVIDNANNSADVQLAANLNTALADAQVYPDEVASAQNIRKHVRDFGYEPTDLVTKRSNNVIAYNKNSNRMEVLDVSKVTSEQLTSSYYAEEVISGYIIVSTGGNDLAEALYSLCNLPAESAAGATISRMSSAVNPVADTVETSISTHVTNALNKIPYSDIRSMVMNVVQATLFVNPDGKIYTIGVSDDGTISATKIDSVPTYDLSDMGSWELPIRSRVAFSETLEEFDIKPLLQARTALTVVVPNTVTLTNTSGITDYSDLPAFSGNVGSAVPSEKVVTVDTAKEIAGEAIVDDIAEAYEQATSTLYNVNQVYTSDFKNNFDSTLEIAKKVYEIKTQKAEGKAVDPIRLVVNGHSTIAGAVTIPSYVDVQIPFALGNVNAKNLMYYELGNPLGGKELGAAYPANNKENLNKPEAEQQYYLCGEGPGNGLDFVVKNSILQTKPEFEDIIKDETIPKIFAAERNISTNQSSYSITIAKNATVNINGRITVGAVIGYPDASGYQGHTSGAYGYITNNGTINVQKGGVLDVFGFIKGDGEVVANDGGIVFEPFVVTDYIDTLGVLWLYPFAGAGGKTDGINFNSPFNRYAVMNIQNTFTVKYGAALYGRVNIVTFGGFLYCHANAALITGGDYIYDPIDDKYVSTDEFTKDTSWTTVDSGETYTKQVVSTTYTAIKNGAFSLSEGASIVSTYTPNGITIAEKDCEPYEFADLANRNSLVGDIGVSNINFHGQISTYGIRMDLLGGVGNIPLTLELSGSPIPLSGLLELMFSPVTVDTSWCIFPVPYNFNFTVATDSVLNIDNRTTYALMPGSKLTVLQGGSLNVKPRSELYVLDTYDTSEFFRNEDGLEELFNKIWNKEALGEISVDEQTGIYELGSLALLGTAFGVDSPILASIKLSLARKYYPSAKLLSSNGFDTSAILTVNGNLTVDGNLGGTVHINDTAIVKLNQRSGRGATLNFGGPYDTTGMFYTLAANNAGNVPFNLLTTVYIPCYLSIVNSENKEFDLTELYENSVNANNAFNIKYNGEFENNVTWLPSKQDSPTKFDVKVYTAKQNITITSSMFTGEEQEHTANNSVAYFTYDLTSDTLTLTDNKQTT